METIGVTNGSVPNDGRSYLQYVLVTVTLCVTLLSGCVPSRGVYYGVSATEGKIVGNACGGLGGPPNTLQLIRGGSKISVTPPNYENDRFLAIRVKIPSSDDVKLDLNQIVLLDADSKNLIKERTLYVFNWKTSKFMKLQINSDLYGDRLTAANNGFSEYEIAIELNQNPPTVFTLIIPNITSTGQEFHSITIKFTKTQGTWASPINC